MKKLYEDYYPSMYPVCLRFANNDSDALDILHDGFIKIFKNIDKYKIDTSLGAWIKRIMINTSIDYYRKETRRRTTCIDDVLDLNNREPDVLSKINTDELIDCLQELPLSYRSVFNLYVIEGYAHKEIAAILGISESTSRSNLVKARIRLKTYLFNKIQYIREEFSNDKRKKNK